MRPIPTMTLLAMASILAAVPTLPARAAAPDKLYAMLAPSVWRVIAADKDKKPMKQGSAVVIAPDTLLTNCHVLKGARSLFVTQANVLILAQLQYADPERDMCQIVARNIKAPAVRLGDSDHLVVGQRIYTLGTPMGLELTLSDGLVSALRLDANQRLHYIQISAPISHGSSGGGLFDDEGRLVGITSAGVDNGQNLNLAIPIKWQRDLARRGSSVADSADLPPVRDFGPAPAATTATTAPAADRRASEPVHASAPVAWGYASIDDVDKVVALAPRAAQAYDKFLKLKRPRAFAFVAGGGYYSTGDKPPAAGESPDPAVRVLQRCADTYQHTCTLYAVDDVVVYRKP
jgi:hypothetical protein